MKGSSIALAEPLICKDPVGVARVTAFHEIQGSIGELHSNRAQEGFATPLEGAECFLMEGI